MAGSYSHIRGGWSLIENMGDAYEAVEQLLWLVESQIGHKRAIKLLNSKWYPMVRGEREPDAAYKNTQKMMDR